LQSIWIVEDDDSIRDLVLYALESAGFHAVGFPSGEEFFAAQGENVPEVILLDIMLPGDDGITILKKLRTSARTEKIPIIMLSAKGAEYDRIKGLDLGADDYITKPFSVMELISRIRAVLRRSSPKAGDEHELSLGGIILRTGQRSVSVCGEAVSLTFKEFELLHYLMENEGIVLSRNKILDTVWGYEYAGESRTVDMHVKTLRQKLGTCGELIRTVRNVGYKIDV
jgi:two-component system alkaline phosphatase synthesis response regulator PhoP